MRVSGPREPVEWTSVGIVGYLDGVEWFRDTDPTHQPPGPMHQTGSSEFSGARSSEGALIVSVQRKEVEALQDR